MGAICSTIKTDSPDRQAWAHGRIHGSKAQYTSHEGPLEEIVKKNRPEDVNLIPVQLDMQPQQETSEESEQDLLPQPQQIEPPSSWIKGELIGSGAFGRVYLGLNNDTGRLMAIKEVPFNRDKVVAGRVARHIKALEDEIRVLQRISHPNVVQYYDNTLNIFLEYVPGGSIASLLAKFGSFKEPVIRAYTRQILQGLEYLHKHKIMHRDIKGDNILVDNTGVVKLADFGASKSMKELATIDSSNFKSMHGTPYFMAPEMIKQTGHGRPADIWSVGCTVIEMATGKPPWSDTEQMSALFKIATSKDPPPIPDTLSPECKDFLLLCFHRDPKLRANATRLLQHPFIVNTVPPPAAYLGMKPDTTNALKVQLKSSPSVPSTIPEDSSSGARASPSTGTGMQPLSPLSNGVTSNVLDRGSIVGLPRVTSTPPSAVPPAPPSRTSSAAGSTRSDSFNPVEEPSWLQPDVSPLGPLAGPSSFTKDPSLGNDEGPTIGAAYERSKGEPRGGAGGTSPTREEREILRFVQSKANQDLMRLSVPFRESIRGSPTAGGPVDIYRLGSALTLRGGDGSPGLVGHSSQISGVSAGSTDLDASVPDSLRARWQQELEAELAQQRRVLRS